jgi:16S rRNA (cytosine1402-N4)-methyltransferase
MHISVLQKEVISYLDPKENENFIDATFGLGGHSKMILDKTKPKGLILGFERDPVLYKKVLKNISERVILVNDSYINMEKVVQEKKFKNISGVLFDLGISNWHLIESSRGFTFKKKEPLDMRFDPREGFSVEKVLNYYSKQLIEKILLNFGEEKKAKILAQKIVDLRKFNHFKNTLQLVEIVKLVGADIQKVFQAFRIAVNKELENISVGLGQALNVLKKRGRLTVISFHSLEDRIVKNFLKDQEKKGLLKIITKKPIKPSLEEIKSNPNSRSAQMRVALKI